MTMDELKDEDVRTEDPMVKAQALIEADRQKRAKLFGEELQALQTKFSCELHTRQELIDGMPNGPSQIIVVAK